MRLLTGTVLPLVLAYGAVVVLLIAAARPPERHRAARPVVVWLSTCGCGYAVFAATMAAYCVAQPRGSARCARSALVEGGALALAAAVVGLLTLVRSRRAPD